MESIIKLFILDNDGEWFIVQWDNKIINVYTYECGLNKFTADQIEQCDVIECNDAIIDVTKKGYELINDIIMTHLENTSLCSIGNLPKYFVDSFKPADTQSLKINWNLVSQLPTLTIKTPTDTNDIYVTVTYSDEIITVPLFDPTEPIGTYSKKVFNQPILPSIKE